ncbi:MAG: fibronectin type III domain-containing protein [Candidatus Planktophila sp.]|nr:fibronectin type III domain-containing protein [Candidatus Planktophila sp.]
MESNSAHTRSVFTIVLILAGFSGMNFTNAAQVKYTVPSAPTNVSVTAGLNSATLRWKAPSNNGGKKITSYRVTYNPGKNIYLCKKSATSCQVPIANPNKPSAKPAPVWFYFTVAAVNSIGTGSESIVGNARVLIRFRATKTIPWTVPDSTLMPTPTPTSSASPSPTTQVSTPPLQTGIKNFDGKYRGTAVVSVTQNEQVISFLSSTIDTVDTVLNGDITGRAGIWKINGIVTDALGIATITASNSLFGSISFTLTFVTDPITKVAKGSGQGISTVDYPGLGSIKISFTFNISSGA